jgi:hypothetical protein
MGFEVFKDRVDGLTSFASTDNPALADWFNDGVREIINLLPPGLLLKCATETSANASELADFDTRGTILGITRSDGVREQPCREIPGIFRGRASDSSDLMFYGTTSDPVFWKWNNKLGIYPEGNVSIQHISYPEFDITGAGDNVDILLDKKIPNFPDEAEYLVVLYAAIKSAESLLASEEDDDLYIPIINVLKSDYMLGLQAIGSKIEAQKQKKATDSNRQMQALVNQMLEYQKQ